MKLNVAVQAYLAYRKNGWSKNTVLNDGKALRKLQAHFGDVQLTSLTPDVMDTFLRSRPMCPDSPNTYNLYMSVLRNFFKWSRQRQYLPIDFDPLVGQRVKPSQEAPKFRIPMEDFPALLDAAKTPRDRMIVAIGLYLMLRESEARTIRLGDVNLAEGTIGVTIHKTNGYDLMPICPELDAELRIWLTYMAANLGELSDEWYLIPQTRPTSQWLVTALNPTCGLAPGGMSRPIQAAVAALGYPSHKVGMHTLRRSAAAAIFLEKQRLGYDGALRQVASWLHHKSQRTSEIYIGVDIDRNTRDREAKEGPLYPSLVADNVIEMRSHGGNTNQAV